MGIIKCTHNCDPSAWSDLQHGTVLLAFFPLYYQWNKEIFVQFREMVQCSFIRGGPVCLWDSFKGTEVNLNVLHAFGGAPSTLTWNTQSWHSVRVWHLFTLSTAWSWRLYTLALTVLTDCDYKHHMHSFPVFPLLCSPPSPSIHLNCWQIYSCTPF